MTAALFSLIHADPESYPVEQVVNDTNPTFFHCTVPGHCQSGMFGIMYVFLKKDEGPDLEN